MCGKSISNHQERRTGTLPNSAAPEEDMLSRTQPLTPAALVCLGLFCASCGCLKDAGVPRVAAVPYSQAQSKASHNSYDRDETIPEQLLWDRSETWQGGCRAIEYDIVQSKTDWRWSVQHDGSYNPDEKDQLSTWLGVLREWADANPGHDIVTLYLDLKNAALSDQEFAARIDALLDASLGADNLYRPGELMGNEPDLVRGAMANGWPLLEELSGKLIVVLSGGDGGAVGARKETYSTTDPASRLAFVDRACGAGTACRPVPASGARVFMNFNASGGEVWEPVSYAYATDSAFVSRGWTVNGASLWDTCLNAAYVNLIATDKIRNHDWATVGTGPFRPIPALPWSGEKLLEGKAGGAIGLAALGTSQLVLVYTGEGGSSMWYQTTTDGHDWRPEEKLQGKTGGGLALGTHGARVHLVYRGEGGENIWHQSFDGARWSDEVKLSGQTKGALALQDYGDLLHLVYSGKSGDTIWHRTYDQDRSEWSSEQQLEGSSGGSVSLAVYEDMLYLAYNGEGGEKLWYQSYDGATWSTEAELPEGLTGSGVALGRYNGRLRIVYTGVRDVGNVWWNSFDGSWGPERIIPGRESNLTPALDDQFMGRLNMVHVGKGGENLYYSYAD